MVFIISLLLFQLHKNAVVEVGKTLFGLSQHTLHTSFFIASHQRQFLFSKSDLQYYTKRAEEIREKLMVSISNIYIYYWLRKTEKQREKREPHSIPFCDFQILLSRLFCRICWDIMEYLFILLSDLRKFFRSSQYLKLWAFHIPVFSMNLVFPQYMCQWDSIAMECL